MSNRRNQMGATETVQADFGGYLTDPVIHGPHFGRHPSQGYSGMRPIMNRGGSMHGHQGMGDIFSDLSTMLDKTWVESRDAAEGALATQFLQTDTGQHLATQAQESATQSALNKAGSAVVNQSKAAMAWVQAHPGKTAAIAAAILGSIGLVVYFAASGAKSKLARR